MKEEKKNRSDLCENIVKKRRAENEEVIRKALRKEEEEKEQAKRPNWAHWRNMASVSLADAAALSLNTNPTFALFDDAIQKRTEIALSATRAGTLPCTRDDNGNFFVTLGDFRAWGETLSTPFAFPPEYPEATPKDKTQKGVPQEKPRKIIKGNDKLFWSQDSVEPEENEEDAMRPNQRENLYCIIAALEKAASLTAKTLHSKMKKDGVDISEKTIGRAFKEAKKIYKEKKSQSTNTK